MGGADFVLPGAGLGLVTKRGAQHVFASASSPELDALPSINESSKSSDDSILRPRRPRAPLQLEDDVGGSKRRPPPPQEQDDPKIQDEVPHEEEPVEKSTSILR